MRALVTFFIILTSVSTAGAESRSKPLIPGAPVEEQLIEHDGYLNSKGESVHAPAHSASGAAPDGATAKCRDGEYSFSHSRSGTCSRHGGVGEWLR